MSYFIVGYFSIAILTSLSICLVITKKENSTYLIWDSRNIAFGLIWPFTLPILLYGMIVIFIDTKINSIKSPFYRKPNNENT
jgi:hypothetical protein